MIPNMRLSRYDEAYRALAEARSVDDLRDVIDKSVAIKEYARRAKNRELEVYAAEIRLRAERRYGELLVELRESGQLFEGPVRKKVGSSNLPTPRVHLIELKTTKWFSSYCQQLAAMPADEFERRLVEWGQTLIEGKGLPAFLAQEKKERRAQREAELGQRILALPQRRFGVILADPEWNFQPWSTETGMDRAAENHYPTSPTDIIASRDVASIAADDSALALWATVPMLPQALEVMEAWGFTYRSHIVWVKDKVGTGYWFRNRHEILLFGTKGDVPCPAPGQQWVSVVTAARGRHSEKPEEFFAMIEQYFPTLPKIELNRRGPARAGWEAWGNEVIEEEALKAIV